MTQISSAQIGNMLLASSSLINQKSTKAAATQQASTATEASGAGAADDGGAGGAAKGKYIITVSGRGVGVSKQVLTPDQLQQALSNPYASQNGDSQYNPAQIISDALNGKGATNGHLAGQANGADLAVALKLVTDVITDVKTGKKPVYFGGKNMDPASKTASLVGDVSDTQDSLKAIMDGAAGTTMMTSRDSKVVVTLTFVPDGQISKMNLLA